jgi:hypothetical protein
VSSSAWDMAASHEGFAEWCVHEYLGPGLKTSFGTHKAPPALKLALRRNLVTFEDLKQEALMGIAKAEERYRNRHPRAASDLTYARAWVARYLMDAADTVNDTRPRSENRPGRKKKDNPPYIYMQKAKEQSALMAELLEPSKLLASRARS